MDTIIQTEKWWKSTWISLFSLFFYFKPYQIDGVICFGVRVRWLLGWFLQIKISQLKSEPSENLLS